MPKTTHAPLTPQQVKRVAPGPIPIDVRDGQAKGLVLTVFPSGRRTFTVRYVWQGKHRRLPIGDFPTVSLAKAREAAEDARTAIRQGRDPVGERQAKRAKPADTVRVLAAEYLKRHARPHKRTADDDERTLNVEVLPRLGDRSVRDLTRRDVRQLLDAIVDRGAPVRANRVLSLIRRLLNFAVDHDWIDANPAARIARPARETSRDRVLTDDEIRALWRLLEAQPATLDKPAPGRASARTRTPSRVLCPIGPSLAAVMKARLLTAQRGGEVIQMRWQDVDLDARWWTIPGAHTKNGEPHRVPLTDAVVALIRAQIQAEVKTAEGPSTPPSAPREGLVFAGRFGTGSAARAKKASAALAKALGFEFRGHDLRRTAATRMAAAGIPRHHISAVLNHVQGGARSTRVYDRHSYDLEKRHALETWARELGRILASESRGDVVLMPTRGA